MDLSARRQLSFKLLLLKKVEQGFIRAQNRGLQIHKNKENVSKSNPKNLRREPSQPYQGYTTDCATVLNKTVPSDNSTQSPGYQILNMESQTQMSYAAIMSLELVAMK